MRGGGVGGGRCPHSPQAASLLSEVGGAGAPWKCFLAASPPPFHPLSEGSMQKGAIWSFVDTFSLVQYLPGVNAGPGSPVSAVCPLPPTPVPHSPKPAQSIAGCQGQAHELGSPAESGRVRSLLVTPTHTHSHRNC